MNIEFFRQLNEYVLESLLEARDDEIRSMLNSPEYPTSDEVATAIQTINETIRDSQRKRLERVKTDFENYKVKKRTVFEESSHRSLPEKIRDIVKAIQKSNDIPQGLPMAFRDQQETASDEDISRIWQNLVELGLIDPDNGSEEP